MFTHTCIAYVNKSLIKLDSLQTVNHLARKKENSVQFVMQYTALNKECMNCVKPEIPVPRINRQ